VKGSKNSYRVKEVNEMIGYCMRIARCFPNTTVLTGFLATATAAL
jgi:hypothetical protein